MYYMVRNSIVALVLLVSSNVCQADWKSDSKQFVTTVSNKIIALIKDKTLDERQKDYELRILLQNNFDLYSIGRFVLARYWRIANEQERKEYLLLFEDMLVKTYTDQFDEYANEIITVKDAYQGSDGGITVSSEATKDSRPPIHIDWKVYNTKHGLRILDIIVNGISMSITQRSEYAAIVQKHGGKIRGLLDEMKTYNLSSVSTLNYALESGGAYNQYFIILEHDS